MYFSIQNQLVLHLIDREHHNFTFVNEGNKKNNLSKKFYRSTDVRSKYKSILFYRINSIVQHGNAYETSTQGGGVFQGRR